MRLSQFRDTLHGTTTVPRGIAAQSVAEWINMQKFLEAQRRWAKRFGGEINRTRPPAVDLGTEHFSVDRESTSLLPILVVAAVVLCVLFAVNAVVN